PALDGVLRFVLRTGDHGPLAKTRADAGDGLRLRRLRQRDASHRRATEAGALAAGRALYRRRRAVGRRAQLWNDVQAGARMARIPRLYRARAVAPGHPARVRAGRSARRRAGAAT